MTRKYEAWHSSNKKTGEIKNFFVSDITEDEVKRSEKYVKDLPALDRVEYLDQERYRPRVATFPVSDLYDEVTQRRRANMLADYLNKIEDAKRQAESEAVFVDLLTAQHPSTRSQP